MSRKYQRISDAQRDILRKSYDAGMVAVGAEHRQSINNAMEETGLSEDQVKVSFEHYLLQCERLWALHRVPIPILYV